MADENVNIERVGGAIVTSPLPVNTTLQSGSAVVGRILADPAAMVQPILTYSSIILKDTNNVLWAVTLNDTGQIVTTAVSGGTAVTVNINDTVGQASWTMGITIGGLVTLNPIAYNPAYPGVLSMLTASSLQTVLFVASGVFVTRQPSSIAPAVRATLTSLPSGANLIGQIQESQGSPLLELLQTILIELRGLRLATVAIAVDGGRANERDFDPAYLGSEVIN